MGAPPCLWHPGPLGAGRTRCVILQECFCGSVLGLCPFPSGHGPHFFWGVRPWAAPGLGSRPVGALGLIGGQVSSHRSAGHGVMGCAAHGSPPACSQGHPCWGHSGGFVLLSSWPETLGPFLCGPVTPPFCPAGCVSSPPPGLRAGGAPQAVESLGRPPCGSRAPSPDEAATGLYEVTPGGSAGGQSCPIDAVTPAVFLAVFGGSCLPLLTQPPEASGSSSSPGPACGRLP